VVSTEDKTHKDKCGNRKGYRMKPKRLGWDMKWRPRSGRKESLVHVVPL
jgi:hypothetical protein